MKTGTNCGFATNPDFDGYQKIPPPSSVLYNLGFDFNDVGFAADTFVRVVREGGKRNNSKTPKPRA